MVVGMVDDDQQILDGISNNIIDEHPEIKIAFCCRSIDGVAERLKSNRVDVLILGIVKADAESEALCRKLYEEKYNVEVIILCDDIGYEYAERLKKYGVDKIIIKPMNGERMYEMMEHIRFTSEIKKGEMELRRRVGSVELTNKIYDMIKNGDKAGIRNIVFPTKIVYKRGGAIKSYEIFLINILCFFLNENGYEDVFEEDIFAEMLNLVTDDQRMNYVMDKYCHVMELISDTEVHNSDDSRIIKAKRYIDEHYDNSELSCDYLAERSGMSARHLRRLFAKTYGMGVQEYIMNVRIEMAKKLLKETVLPIETIISRVGYNSPRYFRKLFKTQLGCTMSEYRNNEEV